jgi:hydrogenase nickel incorporation protein HypA/HybF
MYEQAIARGIVGLVEEERDRMGGRRIDAVHIQVGELSGVTSDVLRSSFASATASTSLAGTKLVVEDVPVRVKCPHCSAPRGVHSQEDFRCVVCDTPSLEVLSGRELAVIAFEVEA